MESASGGITWVFNRLVPHATTAANTATERVRGLTFSTRLQHAKSGLVSSKKSIERFSLNLNGNIGSETTYLASLGKNNVDAAAYEVRDLGSSVLGWAARVYSQLQSAHTEKPKSL